MTGTDDIPPLYMLYGGVVHLDTLNASFSGHYISYVKDLQGNWFRIDDAEHWPSKSQKSSVREQSELSYNFVSSEPSLVWRSDPNCSGILKRENRNGGAPIVETYVKEFSDATSSDWSLFTSSDDASFTTGSTRDSFSTVDAFDASNVDPISSIFNCLYSSQRSVLYCMFPGSKPETRFVFEGRGYVLDSESTVEDGSVNSGAHVKFGKGKDRTNKKWPCIRPMRYAYN
ncbi:Ubiquitin carboxyl-terminal hydrolase 15 [Forsythia ovata]|uniref:Ubiquitin carboxyl-terminal hydrolase 15 n=1 Tax=Forsythia ovata TaxID=205694 RepID=A0ABD1QAA8_9LAMI